MYVRRRFDSSVVICCCLFVTFTVGQALLPLMQLCGTWESRPPPAGEEGTGAFGCVVSASGRGRKRGAAPPSKGSVWGEQNANLKDGRYPQSQALAVCCAERETGRKKTLSPMR